MLASTARGDNADLQQAQKEINLLFEATQPRLKRAHNFQKLAQLRRDLIGVDRLLDSKRVSS